MSSLVAPLSACSAFALAFALAFLYASLFEYVLHRWLMHRHWRLLPYPYQVHALLHHKVFGGDRSFHVQREEDRNLILFEWWQGPLLLLVHAPALWGIELAVGLPVFWSGMAALAAYYACYEYLHFRMHCPGGRWIERTRVFQHLSARHRLHHARWRANFNVVLPLADLVFGTFRPGSSFPSDPVTGS